MSANKATVQPMLLPEYIQFVETARLDRERWSEVLEVLRARSSELRKTDPSMVLTMQSLAVQIERYFDLLDKRKTEFDRAKNIVENAKPIDSQPVIEEKEKENNE